MEETDKWVSTGKAARLISVSRVTMWRYAALGLVEAKRTPSGKLLVRVSRNGNPRVPAENPRKK